MDTYETYNRILTLATAAAHADLMFRREVVTAHDAGRLDVDAVRRLISHRDRTSPSRATAYRRLDQWREEVSDLANPGRGA